MKTIGMTSMWIGLALIGAVPVLLCLGFFGSPVLTIVLQLALAAYMLGSLLDTAADYRDGRIG